MGIAQGAEILNLQLLDLQRCHFDKYIRFNAQVVDVPTTGGDVLGNGHGHAGAIGEATYRLHQALAKGLLAHQQGPVVVLEGSGDDLTGAGRAFVDQNHQGLIGNRPPRGPLDVLNAVAGLGGHNCALIEPLPSNRYTCCE